MISLPLLLSLNDKSSLRKARFCLGIGAQRSGTTWLSRYLDQHPSFLMAPIKEMHVFDSLCLGRDRHRNIESRYARALFSRIPGPHKGGLGKQRDHVFALADRVAMMNIDGGYFKFFEKRHLHQHRAFGEITPEYALLQADDYKQIFKSFPDIGIFYILRDPVSRYLSAINYWARLRPNFSIEQAYLEGLAQKIFTQYTCYHETISRLYEVLPHDHVHILFYEEVFSDPDQHLASLCKFINIEYIKPEELGIPVASKVNDVRQSSPQRRPSGEELKAIRERFKDTYSQLPLLIGRPIPCAWEGRC